MLRLASLRRSVPRAAGGRREFPAVTTQMLGQSYGVPDGLDEDDLMGGAHPCVHAFVVRTISRYPDSPVLPNSRWAAAHCRRTAKTKGERLVPGECSRAHARMQNWTCSRTT